jgi:hypothetical protein
MQSPQRKLRKFLLTGVTALVWISASASAADVQRQILGIDLTLGKDEVHKRLSEIGSFSRAERKSQEIWQVRDQSFSHVVVAFKKSGKLRFVTAVAREDTDAKRVPYGAIGNLEKARQAGDPGINNFNYEWELPAHSDSPRTLVSTRGRDPTFLTTWTLKNVDAP